MGKVIRAFCWYQNFVPKGLYALSSGLYTCIKTWKMCIKLNFEEITLKHATYRQREKAFLLSSKFCPQCVFCPCPGLYTCGKTWKTCIKSDFKEIVLKLATNGTNGQSDQHLSLRGCHPYPGAIYMHKSIKIYTRTRCQVSVYRTTCPLVILDIIKPCFWQNLQFFDTYKSGNSLKIPIKLSIFLKFWAMENNARLDVFY